MSGKTFNHITQESETGAQNEPQPEVTHQGSETAPVESQPQEAQPQE